RPGARRTSRYHIRLPAARLPIIGLELDAGGGNVLRTALVTEPRLAGGRVSPVQLGAATLRRTVYGDAVATSFRIPIASPTGAELDVVIDDADNPPLDIRGIRAVFAPLPYVYFESARGEVLRATYGVDRREPVAAPRYDLEALRDTVKTIAAADARWSAPRETQASAVVSETPAALHTVPGAALDV